MTRVGIGPKTYTLALGALLAGGLVGSAVAASPCKGLDQSQCETKAECLWVEGYVRKDGAKVAAYCKKSGKSSATSSKQEVKRPSAKDKKSGAKETE